MKRTVKRTLLAIVLLAGVAFSSCGATLRLSATAPAQDNDGTCSTPALSSSPAGAARVVHFSWSGPAAGEDSILTTAGTPVTYSATVPPGVYTIRGWATGPGGVGCDTTIVRTVTAPPWRVRFL